MSASRSQHQEIRQLLSNPEHTYRNLIESVKNGIYMADLGGRLFFVNQSCVEFMGYDSKEELLGLNLAKDLYVDSLDRAKFLAEMKTKGYVRDREIKILRKNGSVATLCVTSNYIRNSRGEILGVQGILYDISEQKRLERDLRSEKMKLEELLIFGERVSLIRRLDKLIDFIVGKTISILESDKCSLMLFDDTNAELSIRGAKGLSEDVVKRTRIRLGEAIAGRVAESGHHVLVTDIETDTHFSRKNNPAYKGRSFMSASIKLNERLIGVLNVADKSNGQQCFSELDLKVLSAIATQSAIAIENASLYRELEYLCVTDPLTQVANYRFFVDSLNNEIQRFKRFQRPFSLLVIDIDDFKSYNDMYGHLEGDLLLRELGRIFTGNLRAIDKVCRYGGDEFVALLLGTNIHHAQFVAEKLRQIVERHPFHKPMTVSIGVCEYKESFSRFDFILKGDRALYCAKRTGKNRVYVHNPALREPSPDASPSSRADIPSDDLPRP